ncbi:hypothetical protein [Thiohalobacter thiocyanaticus]|uniref:hypothetical protein n=1 Tax=Thiohalobacter thiocyanaticus TaxID=585455 RepID=UPI000F62CAD6|nr:hypothetical protein [Thiohalobacter thiocyanaticus]
MTQSRDLFVSAALLAFALGGSQPAAARDVNGNYAVFGTGSGDCEDYLEARYRGGADELLYVEWTAGHLSAYNLLLDNTYNLLGNITPFDFMARLDAWCRQHRDQPFTVAVAYQLEDLFGDRRNLAPSGDGGWENWIEQLGAGREGENRQGKTD